jgi:hypothetical protein
LGDPDSIRDLALRHAVRGLAPALSSPEPRNLLQIAPATP